MPSAAAFLPQSRSLPRAGEIEAAEFAGFVADLEGLATALQGAAR